MKESTTLAMADAKEQQLGKTHKSSSLTVPENDFVLCTHWT